MLEQAIWPPFRGARVRRRQRRTSRFRHCGSGRPVRPHRYSCQLGRHEYPRCDR
jgi:hypothetical protein